jgi:hypothetical protein
MAVGDTIDTPMLSNPDEAGYVNRHGLSRKVAETKGHALTYSTSSSPSRLRSSDLTSITSMSFSATASTTTLRSRKLCVLDPTLS